MQTRENLDDKQIDDLEKRSKEWSGKSIRLYTKDELLDLANKNRIWLNGFSCINPSDELLKDVGRMVLTKLQHSNMRDFLGISKEIILTVNMS